MPPLPTIENVFRCTLNITSATLLPVHNTFHVRSAAPATAGDVGSDISAALGQAGADNMLQALPNSYLISSVEVLPLDGIRAAHVQSPGVSWPVGLQAGEYVPEAAVIMTLRTLLRGPAGRGRVFIGPVTESVIANGVPSAAMVTTMAASWNVFRVALGTVVSGLELVVASYQHAIANTVTQIVGKPYSGIQSRRLRRLR